MSNLKSTVNGYPHNADFPSPAAGSPYLGRKLSQHSTFTEPNTFISVTLPSLSQAPTILKVTNRSLTQLLLSRIWETAVIAFRYVTMPKKPRKMSTSDLSTTFPHPFIALDFPLSGPT